MSTHLILGAGPVGRATAKHLAAAGHEPILASRSGQGPAVEGATRIALDATDADAIAGAGAGASSIYNCLNPKNYAKWPQEWPPMANALLAAAEQTGARYLITDNLYAYGRPTGPMRASDPDRPAEAKGQVRADMWAQALRAHEQGRVQVASVRSSDYVGEGIGQGGHVTRQVPAIRSGKTCNVIGDPDQPHSWADIDDVGALLALLGTGPEDHLGRVWIAPHNPPRTQREALSDVAKALGAPDPKVQALPSFMLRALGWVNPMMREINAISYQFTAPFVVDDADTRELLQPTPWETVINRTAAGN